MNTTKMTHESTDKDEDADYLANDPSSMTLEKILLSADTSQFELLGMCIFWFFYHLLCSDHGAEAEDSFRSGFLENEVSFSWE